MANNKKIKKVLDTEMDRKEFLRYVGIVAVGVLGINNLISSITKPIQKTKKPETGGYGRSAYGK